MGTKSNPGNFDCYANAKPDEPIFVLLARDELAPYLVSIWASVRMDDLESAFVKFNHMISKLGRKYHLNPQIEKASEALGVSIDMFRYFQENSAKIRQEVDGHGEAASEKGKG